MTIVYLLYMYLRLEEKLAIAESNKEAPKQKASAPQVKLHNFFGKILCLIWLRIRDMCLAFKNLTISFLLNFCSLLKMVIM